MGDHPRRAGRAFRDGDWRGVDAEAQERDGQGDCYGSHGDTPVCAYDPNARVSRLAGAASHNDYRSLARIAPNMPRAESISQAAPGIGTMVVVQDPLFASVVATIWLVMLIHPIQLSLTGENEQ